MKNKTIALLLSALALGFNSCQLSQKADSGEHDSTAKEWRSEARPLSDLQQEFLDLRFGMFIHFNIPTFSIHDWPDPNTSPEVFNPTGLDCSQWAEAACSAGMTYGCLTTKHHSGFCLWPTQTTDYQIMNSPFKRDIVREYVDAFREKGLKICLYYSILDTHHDIRAGWANPKDHLAFIKQQLTELLTHYGDITCLLLDGWDAEWSRISYEDIPFLEIYEHVKSLQPDCLISDHNAGKYPSAELFYSDVKQYEQNAGQMIPKETNLLPAQAGIPINKFWFWKEYFPTAPVVSAEDIVYKNLIPLNEAHCNFILNVAPNREGLIDDNAVKELKRVGQLWKHAGKAALLPELHLPIIADNIAKGRRMNSSWSFGKRTSDLASDDDFTTCWVGQEAQKEHYVEVTFDEPTEFNALCFVEGTDVLKYPALSESRIASYDIRYFDGARWTPLPVTSNNQLVRLFRFTHSMKATKVRINLHDCQAGVGIAEFMIYNEKI